MAYNETDRGAKYAESAHYQADPRTWADNAAKEVESISKTPQPVFLTPALDYLGAVTMFKTNRTRQDYGCKRGTHLMKGAALLAGALALAACTSSIPAKHNAATEPTAAGTGQGEVTLVAYDSFPLSEETIAAFKKKTGYDLKVVKSGDGVELTNKIILTKDAPLGDAVFGMDNNTAQAAVKAGALADFTGQLAPSVTKARGAEKQLVPIDQGEVCVNYDIKYFQDKGLKPPATFDDLAAPAYQNLTVVQSPQTSTPGLAFMLATIKAKGENSWQNYWKALKANGVKVTDSWDTAFNADFTAGGNKNKSAAYPIMVSYASSPAWAVNEAGDATTIGNVPDTCYRQVEYAAVLQNAKNPEGAAALVKFLTEETAQKDLVENNYMYPVLDSVSLPEPLAKFGAPSGKAVSLDDKQVSEKREAWVRAWTEIMS
ncbi:thiamine transport system substrate-binding protein [Mobiluncus mulieris]|uniref:thiamine ABC transporter substrate-binding protein n=1 Tax=Mobiluncus mulieris TaxID=2052 RepID=UPI0017EAC7C6|nr:thiamine ABC transporter substrate-binding protein [Mobiluncus mulieris]MBB5846172.1 thiamine transport system substrate-binding protein [Mobiluncus mulieris]